MRINGIGAFWVQIFGHKKKRATCVTRFSAEREGFEPPVPLSTAVFKTAVIDHSTTFPVLFQEVSCSKAMQR